MIVSTCYFVITFLNSQSFSIFASNYILISVANKVHLWLEFSR